MDESNHSLALRSRLGDRGAFEQVIRQTGRLVYAQLYLDTGDKHQAEDLTQETFLTAWRNIRQLKQPDAMRSWLLSIAHTVLLDAIKKSGRKKRGKVMNSDGLENLTDSAPGPAKEMEEREQRQRALTALRALPPDYQQPLALKFLAGADYDTISQQLNLTNGSLRGLLSRGMDLLREKMKSEFR